MAGTGYDISASVSTSSSAASRAGEGDITLVSFGKAGTALAWIAGLVAVFILWKMWKGK